MGIWITHEIWTYNFIRTTCFQGSPIRNSDSRTGLTRTLHSFAEETPDKYASLHHSNFNSPSSRRGIWINFIIRCVWRSLISIIFTDHHSDWLIYWFVHLTCYNSILSRITSNHITLHHITSHQITSHHSSHPCSLVPRTPMFVCTRTIHFSTVFELVPYYLPTILPMYKYSMQSQSQSCTCSYRNETKSVWPTWLSLTSLVMHRHACCITYCII